MHAKFSGFLAVAGAALFVSGCGNLGAVIDVIVDQATTVSIEFVNNTDFDVEVEFYRSDIENLSQDVLTSSTLNPPETINLSPGETATRSFDCDDARSLAIEDAELNLLAGIGPKAEIGPLYLDDDFDCGDTVTFSMESSDGSDLDIDLSVVAKE